MELNQIVAWKECPPSVPAQTSRIRGLSPCGNYALIDWVSTPVAMKDLIPVEALRPYPYKPHSSNNWLLTGVDLATPVKSYQYNHRRQNKKALLP